MRIWTIHPCHLDRQGLVALWREALLAQAVLRGKTTGYRRHPQLKRFRAQPAPLAAIGTYLAGVHAEAVRRGYCFDGAKIAGRGTKARVVETSGQLAYEWRHLLAKLRRRSPGLHAELSRLDQPRAHPLFRIVPGPVQTWEKQK